MYSKERISEELISMVDGIRNPPPIMQWVPGLPHTKARFNSLLKKCVELHRRISELPNDQDTWEETQILLDIEAEYKRLRAILILAPSVLVVYALFAAFFALLNFVDITGFLKNVLHVQAPERLLTFGIAGALFYLATSVLAHINREGANLDVGTRAADIAVRILLAVIVPVVLVSLLFTQDGAVKEIVLSPELLALACGFSAKLVVETFNKIVEKVSKMIEVI